MSSGTGDGSVVGGIGCRLGRGGFRVGEGLGVGRGLVEGDGPGVGVGEPVGVGLGLGDRLGHGDGVGGGSWLGSTSAGSAPRQNVASRSMRASDRPHSESGLEGMAATRVPAALRASHP